MTTSLTSVQRVYLAGPGVFFPDPLQWGEEQKAACAACGLQGLYPLDQAVPEGLDKAGMRHWIAHANYALIREADAVFADLRTFRSVSEPDSGTAFEVGFAFALGKPVWLWLPDGVAGVTQLDRVANTGGMHPRDGDGLSVEDFAAPLNLMLWEAAAGVSYGPDVHAALAAFACWLRR
ncbi:nucleoside 2-deoxyribosyltransferase [Chitinilyticum piscinae]|uniref:Nucleoside 2-deoxyribosyltransferase n=1 Tax=Chitinilyticum piscinae TaxID=2866724 RepID=A0A8J7FPF1_9NEIS|nr:nucleoside 2-deoxyribosyltransferase [Chitinilyticum piscinae]MBE9608136.1 nucleoside 2-deoxyribosyltransferase [Chitinilyticum piscinae]